MVKKLESYELDLNINKNNIDKQVDKYLDITHKITKIFYEEDLNLDEAEIVLQSILHGILKCRVDGYMNVREIN